MKIKRIHFVALRNNEHFQCQTEFKALVEEFDASKLKIEELFINSYLPLYKEEDEAIIKITKSSFTEARLEIDNRRNSTFRGMVDMNKSSLNHFKTEVVDAAKRLKILFDTYGNISRLPLQEETSAIYNLLQELSGTYAGDAETVGLKEWVSKLEEDNKAYEALVKEGYEESAAQTDLNAKEVRTEIDGVFRRIIGRLEALMLIEGEETYSAFVRRLNVQLEHYANILAQRQGRNAGKKNEQEQENEETENKEMSEQVNGEMVKW